MIHCEDSQESSSSFLHFVPFRWIWFSCPCSSYPFHPCNSLLCWRFFQPILVIHPSLFFRSVEDISEFLVFNFLIISRCSTSSSSLHTGAISIFLVIFSTVISLSGPITHRFFPRISPDSFNHLRRSLNLFNYDVSMIFISHIPYTRSIWVNSHNFGSTLHSSYSGVSQLFLVLFLVIILSLQIRRSVFLESWSILLEIHHFNLVLSSSIVSILSNPFLAIRCISELFHSRFSEGHHFRRFFVLSFQLSSSILLNCCLFVVSRLSGALF